MEKETIKELINNFINGKIDEIFVPVIPIYQYNEILEELEFIFTEFDTNGWQLDFWYSYNNENFNFNLELLGSFYFGDYRLTKIYN